MLGQAVRLPDTAATSASSIREIWANAETNEVAIRFDSDIRIYYSVWPPKGSSTAADFYVQEAKESGVGTATFFGDNPGYYVEQGAQGGGAPPDSVADVTVGNLELSIHANLPVEELRDIADSA